MKRIVVKTRKMSFKVTPDPCRAIEQRAESRGLRVGTWMRLILLQAASKPAHEGYIRVHEPKGETT